MVRLRTAIALALLVASPAVAEEEEEESFWVDFLVQGRGFSTFHALPAHKLRGLGEAEVRRRLANTVQYSQGQTFEAEIGVPYYYLPRCHRAGSVSVLVHYRANQNQRSLTLQCRT